MRILKTSLLMLVLSVGACGDDDSGKSNLGVGEKCTKNGECASDRCAGGVCVAAPGTPDGGGGTEADAGGGGGTEDAGTGGTEDGGTGGTEDGGTGTQDGGTGGAG
jgi:hypothetical protein